MKSSYYYCGEEIQIAPYNRQFGSKIRATRFNNLCGYTMNFILAFVIFVILGFVQGVPIDKPMVGKVMDNSAAQQAGLKENDTIQAIDGKTQVHGKMLLTLYVKIG